MKTHRPRRRTFDSPILERDYDLAVDTREMVEQIRYGKGYFRTDNAPIAYERCEYSWHLGGYYGTV